MRAVRNIRLCTKDCLCLYVCPTGASDTETGQIDAAKCIGCGKCAGACPSHAISMVPYKYPKQQSKAERVKQAMLALAESKSKQERAARQLAEKTESPVLKQLASAVEKSNRLMAEDILRESGYMLPQSKESYELLSTMLNEAASDDFPKEAVAELLERLDFPEVK